MIEIGNHRVGQSIIIRREDKLICPSIKLLQSAVGSYCCFCCSGSTYSYNTHAMPLILCLVNQFTSLLAYFHLLGVHLVLRQVFHLNRVEATKSTMKSDISKVYTSDFHHLHHLATEMKTSGRSSDSTLVLGIDSLEIVHVIGSGRAAVNDISWQRCLTKTI